MSELTLEAKGLKVVYPNGHKAIENVSFVLEAANVCALVGVNGSGKSTLFNSIMGIITPTEGEIFINQMPISYAIKKNLLSYVPQNENIDWDFPISVYEVVMQGRFGYMGFLRRPKEEDKKIVAEAMERLKISDLADRQIGELSGGQKKRVFLARALAQKSRLILLDEPFTGVDVKTEEAVMNLLKELRKEGYLILVSTHNLGTIPDYCNRVIMIYRTIIVQGKTEEVFTHENLAKTFGGVLKHIHLDREQSAISIITDDEKPAVFLRNNNE